MMRRLPGSTAFSVFYAALAIGTTSCGLRTTLDLEPGAPSQAASTGRLDGGAVSPDAATNAPGKTDASAATGTLPVPDASTPIATAPDAAVGTPADARPGTVRLDAAIRAPEVGGLFPPAGRDASVGRTDLGAANRDAGVPPTPPARDAGFTPPRLGTDGGLTFPSPDLDARGPRVRDAGLVLPGLGIDAGFAPPFAMDGGFTFGGRDAGRARPDGGRGWGAGTWP